jgi:hypothetical protein
MQCEVVGEWSKYYCKGLAQHVLAMQNELLLWDHATEPFIPKLLLLLLLLLPFLELLKPPSKRCSCCCQHDMLRSCP